MSETLLSIKNLTMKFGGVTALNDVTIEVKKCYPQANEKECALLMEFVLHGLAAFSLINKKMIDDA